MTAQEQTLADRLGLEKVRVVHGVLDGRSPLTTVTLKGPVPGSRWSTVARDAADQVWRNWPDAADEVDVYLRYDPAADPVFRTFRRDV